MGSTLDEQDSCRPMRRKAQQIGREHRPRKTPADDRDCGRTMLHDHRRELRECPEYTTTAPGSQARLVRTVNLTAPETFLRRAGDKQREGICWYPSNLSVRGDGFQGLRGGRNMRD